MGLRSGASGFSGAGFGRPDGADHHATVLGCALLQALVGGIPAVLLVANQLFLLFIHLFLFEELGLSLPIVMPIIVYLGRLTHDHGSLQQNFLLARIVRTFGLLGDGQILRRCGRCQNALRYLYLGTLVSLLRSIRLS